MITVTSPSQILQPLRRLLLLELPHLRHVRRPMEEPTRPKLPRWTYRLFKRTLPSSLQTQCSL